MNTYNEFGIRLHGALVSFASIRGRDDRGEVSSYLILVALLALAAIALGGRFMTFFGNLMTKTCGDAGTSC